MEKVNKLKSLGSVLCKQGSMESKTRERFVQGRNVIGSLERMMKVRTVDMTMKKGLCDGIIVPTIYYVSKMRTGNENQRSRIQAVEMSFLRRACGARRIDSESNESVYNKYGMSSKDVGMKCGKTERVNVVP